MIRESDKKSLWWEWVGLTLALMGVTHILYSLLYLPFVQLYLATLVAVLFLYAPVGMLGWRKRPIDFIDRTVRDYGGSLLWFGVTLVVIMPVFVLASHFWMQWVSGWKHFEWASFENFGRLASYHLLMVALPEEFYCWPTS